ncbi:MAG: tRNA lysidine(34) synthetase TilS, partial [Oscillospiraceae bacterium]|nr:tRNA lysidine(34) synthetase TilS [Oscillospiraceae bacterium]
ARELRYEALFGCDGLIATAHNMCDNAETVLFNITRGTGIRGICGIPYVRGRIIRPLLDVSREEIEAYLAEKGLSYVTDSTNLSDDYTRNKIRHNVIPVLTSIDPAFFRAVGRLSDAARTDEDHFDEILSGLTAEDVPTTHTAVRRRYIARVLTENSIPVSYDRICELDEIMGRRGSTKVCLSGDLFAVFRKGVMRLERIHELPAFEKIVDLDGCEIVTPYDKTVKIRRISCDDVPQDQKVHRILTYNALDRDRIQGVPVLRNKRDGDRIQLAGRGHVTRLKKFYNSLGLTYEQRASALVIEDDLGLIWSEYGGAAERAKASDGDMIVIEI